MPRDPRVYLDDILESITQIETYIEGMDFESFSKDRKTIDAVVRNLEIIGEAARALPDDIREMIPGIEWHKIIGLRNILIHEYFGVNTTIVWDIINKKLTTIKQEVKKALN
jgi:uncharacterized protein with HEPN domain